MMWRTGDVLPLVNVGLEHTIDLKPGAEPRAGQPRRLSQVEIVEVRDEIEGLRHQGLIEDSLSPCNGYPDRMCKEKLKNGRLRLAMDYRALNAQSITNSVHPIPLIEDCWIDRVIHVFCGPLEYVSNA